MRWEAASKKQGHSQCEYISLPMQRSPKLDSKHKTTWLCPKHKKKTRGEKGQVVKHSQKLEKKADCFFFSYSVGAFITRK